MRSLAREFDLGGITFFGRLGNIETPEQVRAEILPDGNDVTARLNNDLRSFVVENVALAAFYGEERRLSRAQAFAHARDLLELVGLPGEPGTRVDGLGAAGLKKLELARALATQPKLLLADESLGGLDEKEMDQAASLLARIRDQRGITIIWVEHIMGVLMRVVDRCVVLDHGEVIAQGKPEEVAHDPRVIEVYLGSDAQDVQATVAARRG